MLSVLRRAACLSTSPLSPSDALCLGDPLPVLSGAEGVSGPEELPTEDVDMFLPTMGMATCNSEDESPPAAPSEPEVAALLVTLPPCPADSSRRADALAAELNASHTSTIVIASLLI